MYTYAHIYIQTRIWNKTWQNIYPALTKPSLEGCSCSHKSTNNEQNYLEVLQVLIQHNFCFSSPRIPAGLLLLCGLCSPWFLTKVIYLHHSEWKATFWIISAKQICAPKAFLPFLGLLHFITQTKIPFSIESWSHTLDRRLGVRSPFLTPYFPHCLMWPWTINSVSGVLASPCAKAWR